jgi:hypothetical protein
MCMSSCKIKTGESPSCVEPQIAERLEKLGGMTHS